MKIIDRIMKRSIFLFCLLLGLIFNIANVLNVFAATDFEAVFDKVKNQLEGIHTYAADMNLTCRYAKEVHYKAHVFYKEGDFRVEMISPGSAVYLFKNDQNYLLSDKDGTSKYSRFIAPDFANQELVGSAINTINNLACIRDKKMVSDGENYRVSGRGIFGDMVMEIDKNIFTIQKMISYTDRKKHTECVFTYKKVGKIYFPVIKEYNDLNQGKLPNIIVKIENLKLNCDLSDSLFPVPIE